MKLRFRGNTVRLRLNRSEVSRIALGEPLREELQFPRGATFAYVLEPGQDSAPDADYLPGMLRVVAPRSHLQSWANSLELGLSYDLPLETTFLRILIEKDLECIDGPEEERDPDAFSRSDGRASC